MAIDYFDRLMHFWKAISVQIEPTTERKTMIQLRANHFNKFSPSRSMTTCFNIENQFKHLFCTHFVGIMWRQPRAQRIQQPWRATRDLRAVRSTGAIATSYKSHEHHLDIYCRLHWVLNGITILSPCRLRYKISKSATSHDLQL